MTPFKADDITIRTALRPGDIGYVTHMHGRIYYEEYHFCISFETYVAEGLNEFFQLYDPQNNRVWICEHDNRMVGFLLLMNRGTAAQLRYFIIEKDYRGIGLGKKLMALYMDFLRQCKYETSFLWTTYELHAAAALYKMHGFVLTEEKKSEAFGKPLTEQRYDLWVL
jgi:peptidyl-dipeptidase Dcp